MIAREWRGTVATDRLTEYVAYVRETGVNDYLITPGNLLAYILTRNLGDDLSEVVAFSVWNSYDDIRRFTGNDIDEMVLYSDDHVYLVGTPTVIHYDVIDPSNPTRSTGASS